MSLGLSASRLSGTSLVLTQLFGGLGTVIRRVVSATSRDKKPSTRPYTTALSGDCQTTVPSGWDK